MVNVPWWNKLGKPQYGGELVMRANSNIVDFDPCMSQLANIYSLWLEKLVADDWTLNPAIFDYKPHWHPSLYMRGNLAQSWEFTDQCTYVVHLKTGICWQNIPPANGREFIADDVVFHYNRLRNLSVSSSNKGLRVTPVKQFQDLISVHASDKYTVVFKWKNLNPELIMETLHQVGPPSSIENPDAVIKWGDVSDWHHAIGTGPFILKDFDSDNSAILVKNDNYWGYDERHPDNRLPYLDRVKFLIIPDEEQAIAAMREGKIDIMDQVSPLQAQAIRKTNPEILLITHPDSNPFTIDPRNDIAPFNDIRIRKAMQKAIDLQSISKNYYRGSVEPYPVTFTSRYMKEWGLPYEEWPPDLKDEYAYNPAAAKALLAEAGYPNGFKTNIVVDKAADTNLLGIVKSYFAQVGIDMEIRMMQTDAWVDFVMIGHRHDQLAHHPGGPLGHTSSPNHDLKIFQKGSRANYTMVDDPVFNAFLPKALASTSLDDVKQVMRDANEYVARQHFTISLLQPMGYSLCQPWLKGFNAQFGSAWAHGGGPGMLSFYLGRFWIDHDLKKSLGR
jgi:ABC-type transport system substrate-binding protein